MNNIDDKVEVALKELLKIPNLDNLIGEYLKGPPETQFAGNLFDKLGCNKRNEVEASDLVAVSLLDVRFGADAVKQLLDGGFINQELVAIPDDKDLWDVNESVIADLEGTFLKLKKLRGVGRTKATKLLARKRPRIAPISDSVVENFYGLTEWEYIRPLAKLLQPSLNYRNQLDELVDLQSEYKPATLRILDIAIWMTRSKSQAAKSARKKFGFSE